MISNNYRINNGSAAAYYQPTALHSHDSDLGDTSSSCAEEQAPEDPSFERVDLFVRNLSLNIEASEEEVVKAFHQILPKFAYMSDPEVNHFWAYAWHIVNLQPKSTEDWAERIDSLISMPNALFREKLAYALLYLARTNLTDSSKIKNAIAFITEILRDDQKKLSADDFMHINFVPSACRIDPNLYSMTALISFLGKLKPKTFIDFLRFAYGKYPSLGLGSQYITVLSRLAKDPAARSHFSVESVASSYLK